MGCIRGLNGHLRLFSVENNRKSPAVRPFSCRKLPKAVFGYRQMCVYKRLIIKNKKDSKVDEKMTPANYVL
jgi:hypothetical protein